MNKKNILVFPCGSEIALEIHRSFEFSKNVVLYGASSIDDHGKFIFENYIEGIPYFNDPNFITAINDLVCKYEIDAIYPAMDSVITFLKKHEKLLKCDVISSCLSTVEMCNSKSLTYNTLDDVILIPKQYDKIENIINYPVFLKPDIGYGSRGAIKVNTKEEALLHIKNYENILILEFLPGKEYTIDCFTDFNGDLLFAGSRQRKRISNGISVKTNTMSLNEKFNDLAKKINEKVKFNGAWFFQVKERQNGDLVLLEVAARFGGSSSVYRAKGVNFAELTFYNHFNIKTNILVNDFEVELDRALDNKYKLNISFTNVYLDFDDTLLIDNKINHKLISLIYKYRNEGKKIILITKHSSNIFEKIKVLKIDNLFDNVIHLKPCQKKSNFIKNKDSIFIDDSFLELQDVHYNCGIPVFGVNMIDALLNTIENV